MIGDKSRDRLTAQKTGNAYGGAGSIVNSGVFIVPGLAVPQRVRASYRYRVRQIFPGKLVGRETELAELAEFCTRAEGPSYAWWQGEAWTGKSALMATFVLNPPAGVRVVSFFITARWAGQNTRAAFLEAVLPQLAEITGDSLPDGLSEAHREEWFFRLLDEAACVCAEQGERLVLVVDGLDEDRGVTVGPNAHSIAALLPAHPECGARVIVSGRPNPPIPDDVPSWHPLNDPQIIRRLSPSPAAQVARREAERELRHLIDDGGVGRDLLGLVTAAGGGLSAQDLAELTGSFLGQVERHLRTVTGRTFSDRDSTWQHDQGPVFVLAHEELQQTALDRLRGELNHWRDRLHAWADRYREQGWPTDTPEYLLRGYIRMLLEVGDLPRMVELATDRARLDRMLDVSGGDATARADIIAIQEFIRDQPDPDLAASLRLAYTRTYLDQRNRHIPPRLPAVWAALGHYTRAEALARSITDPSHQARALTQVAEAVAKAGDPNRAETIARSITNPSHQAQALAQVAEVMAKSGDLDIGRRLLAASLITADPSSVLRALIQVDPQAVASIEPNWLGVEVTR